MREFALVLLVLAAVGCAHVQNSRDAERAAEEERRLEREISLLHEEERILTRLVQNLEYELGPTYRQQLKALRDQTYAPEQRMDDLITTKRILSRRVNALKETRRLYWNIASGPY